MNLSQQNETPSSLENPFFHRGPIRDRRYFFGRTAETRRCLQMLRNDQCVSIVGPRRIGKTSFLFHLNDPESQKEYDLGEQYLFVYIDCQSLGNLDKLQCYQWLWQDVRRSLAGREEVDSWVESISSFSELREAVMTIQEKGYKPAFLFDEFETIAQSLNLDQDLFSDLRSLVPTVIYATASQDSLYDLTYADRSVLSSPFFNIFEEVSLGLLKSEEAKEMVEGLLRMAGQENLFTEKDLAFVLGLGGYHPFFLQLACYYLFEQKMERSVLAAADYESVEQRYAEAAEMHFRYAWDHLGEDEQKFVQLVCDKGVSQLNDEQKRRLERQCIFYDNAIFSSTFVEFARRQMPETETKEAHELHRTATNPSIQKLARLMQELQEQREPPYVLLLGSGLSLTPSVRYAFARTEDWEAFWKEMQRASPTERKAMLKKPLDALGLERGYQAIAHLAKAGYFNLILTLNVDDAIDDAMRPLPAEQSVLMIYDGSNAAQIVETLSRDTRRIKVVKLRGDINAQALPLTATGTFEFPEDLQQSVAERLKRDMILVGDIPYDTDVQRCITRSTSALWCILPDEPASDSFVMRARQSRPPGEIITGADAEFNKFFITLAEKVLER